MAQPMQQQPVFNPMSKICVKTCHPCSRDGMAIELNSRAWGRLRISRCDRGGACGELFVYQFETGREMPLHVLFRMDEDIAVLAYNAYREAMECEKRSDEILSMGGVDPR